MEMTGRPGFRFQYSLRTLFVVTAIAALLLVPVAWVAREAALRAVILAERDRAVAVEARYRDVINAQTGSVLSTAVSSSSAGGGDPSEAIARKAEKAPTIRPDVVEQLVRENSELKKKVEQLHREIERLKGAKAKG